MKEARRILNHNSQDNMTLECKNLEQMAVQRYQNWDKEETTWIFKDNSALVNINNNWRVVNYVAFNCDNEQL